MVPPGPALSVGRKAPADFVLTGDPTLSRLHFSLQCEGDRCRIRDLNSLAGILLNGNAVKEAVLNDGDEITAGSTTFVMRISALDLPVPPLISPASGPAAAGVALTSAAFADADRPRDSLTPTRCDGVTPVVEPLFAILDAASDPLPVLAHLLDAKEEHQSLYEGPTR